MKMMLERSQLEYSNLMYQHLSFFRKIVIALSSLLDTSLKIDWTVLYAILMQLVNKNVMLERVSDQLAEFCNGGVLDQFTGYCQACVATGARVVFDEL
ncbi:MAG: hypothetical protein EZS28_039237 [Streblomastix strix]|uniref:Uncharacterized protein n=1 Tax=Streblomastix strix TaxID=222440 RepID=A0A5J4U3R3_9EUKA|nr:MAG: hypothetical protein EZS28_039237 [Streblomastix strix]